MRSIKSIHIDLVPSAETRPLSSSSSPDLSRVKSIDSAASGDDGFRTQALGKPSAEKPSADRDRPDSRSGFSKGIVKERRHQIPGLRQTPYLKILFLRCDDNETYKSQARKQVREWIKEHTPPAQSTTKASAQENHDAYEWLIVHIIVPNTAAASQPRTSTKGSSTLLEKLRADFNGTSKSAVDRVAQIRIGINDVPYDLLPRVVPAIPGTYSETAQENAEAWSDLIQKFKSLILASFDMRVSQYEDDIREKDAQRALPGWNFCTFFVLKEGLARGFESVGLVEDALVGYDELAVGLDAIIREQVIAGSGAEHGGSFLPYTEDLRKQLERSRAAVHNYEGIDVQDTDGPIDLQSAHESHDHDEIPLSASRKNYRDLILANNISIFDFRCYLFARQISLLLRMANAWSSREELLAKLKEQRESSLQGVAARQAPKQPAEETENLAMLGEICRRALDFIASISRIMREDLLTSDARRRQQVDTRDEPDTPEVISDAVTIQVTNNLVSSFTFSVAQQILALTSTKSLPIPPSTLAPPDAKMSIHGQEPKATIPEPKTMMHPARSTSLRMTPREPPSPGIFPGRGASVADQAEASKSGSAFIKTGLEELASHRAELYVLSRSVLERLGSQCGWLVGWNVIAEIQGQGDDLEDVDLNDENVWSEQKKPREEIMQPFLHGIDNKLLRTGVDNEDDFYRLYETLTDKALRHYTVADHIQSVQTKMADLAILKYYLYDYGAAASYFYRMTPFYGEGGWEGIEICMLAMYTKCLKELKQHEEYVRVALKLLAKGAAVEKERLRYRSALNIGTGNRFGNEGNVSIDGYLEELMTVIPKMQHDTHVPLHSFFANMEVDGNVIYHEDQDSFRLQLKMHYLLLDDLVVEKAKARMVFVSGQGRDIWLETEETVTIKNGIARLYFQSNVSWPLLKRMLSTNRTKVIIPGAYVVKQVVLHASRMILSYESEALTQLVLSGPKFFKCPRLLLYQRPDAFDVKLFASKYLRMDRNRFVEIELCSGWNNVLNGELHIRAATAGLRLQTSDVKVVNNRLDISKKSEAGVIRFGALQSESKVKILVPFSLENDASDISLKLEISYTTERGTFFLAIHPSISILLPLDVNVQDVFKHKALYSKFTISSATSSPLRLLKSKLEPSDTFETCNGGDLPNPVMIFPRQPASLLYKIVRRSTQAPQSSSSASRKKNRTSLSLIIHYICLEEEIDDAVASLLMEALSETPLHQYNRLIIPTVLTQLNSRLTPYILERTALVGEFSTSILSGINWSEFFYGLGRRNGQDVDVAASLAHWIQTWFEQQPHIKLQPLETSEETVAKTRSIIIPVDIPSVTAVHTADIKLIHKAPIGREVVATTNEPISASLEIKSTRIWDSKSPGMKQMSQVGGDVSETADEIDFAYEVSVPTDTWIIGGKRKGHFRILSSKYDAPPRGFTFPIVLIPIREGYLPYPHLEIKPSPISKPAASDGRSGPTPADDQAGKANVITCETDYKNFGETIRVISNARKTTVSLDASSPQGGAWLLESEKRVAEDGLFLV